MGIKLSSYPTDVLKQNQIFEFYRRDRELKRAMSSLAREYSRKGIDKEELAEQMARQVRKRQRLAKEYGERLQ